MKERLDAQTEQEKEMQEEMRSRRCWAAYLIYPCVFFNVVATRVPIIFASMYPIKGLNLPGYMGVLGVPIYTCGRVIAASFLSKTGTELGTNLLQTGSSVVAFVAIMCIPAFPNTNCNEMGFECFEEGHMSFLFILVRTGND